MSKDRHRKGYYEDYAKRTGKKDRHRKGYYKDYNKKHPERLARVGIHLDDVPFFIGEEESMQVSIVSDVDTSYEAMLDQMGIRL